jgi:Kinesin motor domain
MPRAMTHLFQALANSRKFSSWKMQLSYIEVYQNKIYDLLRAPGASAAPVEGDLRILKDGVVQLKNIMPTEVSSQAVRFRTRCQIRALCHVMALT